MRCELLNLTLLSFAVLMRGALNWCTIQNRDFVYTMQLTIVFYIAWRWKFSVQNLTIVIQSYKIWYYLHIYVFINLFINIYVYIYIIELYNNINYWNSNQMFFGRFLSMLLGIPIYYMYRVDPFKIFLLPGTKTRKWNKKNSIADGYWLTSFVVAVDFPTCVKMTAIVLWSPWLVITKKLKIRDVVAEKLIFLIYTMLYLIIFYIYIKDGSLVYYIQSV